MQNQSVTKTKKATRKVVKKSSDKIFDEDWGEAARASGSAIVVRPLLPTSIKLDPKLVAMLVEKGKKRGLGYQTMLKVIVHEHIDEY